MTGSTADDGAGAGAEAEAGASQRLVRLGQALLLLFAGFVVASAVTAPLLGALVGAGVLVADTVAYAVVETVTQFVGFAVAVGGYVLVTRDRDLLCAGAPTQRELAVAAAGVAVLLAGQFGLIALFSAFGVEVGQNQAITVGEGRPRYYLYMVVVSLVVVGPVEELLFRGGVQGLLRRAYGPVGAIAVATTIFGLVHYAALVGTPTQRLAYVSVAVVLGGVLGALYEWTDNLVVPAVVHGAYNATLFGLQYVDAVGG